MIIQLLVKQVGASFINQLTFLLIQFHAGLVLIRTQISFVFRGGIQISILQETCPFRPASGVGVVILVIGTDVQFIILYAAGIDVDAGLRSREETLVKKRTLAVLIPHYEYHSGFIHVQGIAYQGYLVFLVICGNQGVAFEKKATVIAELIPRLAGIYRRSCAQPQIAEPALLIFLLQGYVQYLLHFSVLYARSLGLVGFLVYHAYLVNHGGREIVQRGGLVVEEESPPADGELVYFLPVELDLAFRGDFHAGHTAQKVLEHSIGPHAEGRCIELYGILLYDYGIADIRHHSGPQELFVHLQKYGPHIDLVLTEIPLLHERPVAHHFDVEGIDAIRNAVQLRIALGVGHSEIGDSRILARDYIDRSIRDGFLSKGVLHLDRNIADLSFDIFVEDNHLCLSRKKRAGNKQWHQKGFSHSYSQLPKPFPQQ